MLIIQPSGGLCNRMRVINSAYILAKKRNESLTVVWKNCDELNCPFEHLFQLPSELKVLNIRSDWNLKKLYLQFTSNQRVINSEIEDNKTAGVLHDDFYHSLKKNVYISTWEHFYPSGDYHLFTPTPAIRKRIDAITAAFGGHCVGVHIRRTDHTWAIENSPTTGFAAAMEQELELHPDTKFYLATDDAHEELILREKFPDCIISNTEKTLERSSIKGMEDALIDLMCLSSTTKIFGSYFSSFTDIAAEMNGIEKIVIE